MHSVIQHKIQNTEQNWNYFILLGLGTMLGIKPKALHLPSKYPTSELYPQLKTGTIF